MLRFDNGYWLKRSLPYSHILYSFGKSSFNKISIAFTFFCHQHMVYKARMQDFCESFVLFMYNKKTNGPKNWSLRNTDTVNNTDIGRNPFSSEIQNYVNM